MSGKQENIILSDEKAIFSCSYKQKTLVNAKHVTLHKCKLGDFVSYMIWERTVAILIYSEVIFSQQKFQLV